MERCLCIGWSLYRLNRGALGVHTVREVLGVCVHCTLYRVYTAHCTECADSAVSAWGVHTVQQVLGVCVQCTLNSVQGVQKVQAVRGGQMSTAGCCQ